jgi:putative SOS response-associated peptidase YedK
MSGMILEVSHDKDFFVLESGNVEAWLDGKYDAPAFTGKLNDAPKRITDVLLSLGVIKQR